MLIYNMGLFEEVELITPYKKQNNKTLKIKSLKWYDAIREKLDEGNTLNVRSPVVNKKPKTKVSIGLKITIYIVI